MIRELKSLFLDIDDRLPWYFKVDGGLVIKNWGLSDFLISVTEFL